MCMQSVDKDRERRMSRERVQGIDDLEMVCDRTFMIKVIKHAITVYFYKRYGGVFVSTAGPLISWKNRRASKAKYRIKDRDGDSKWRHKESFNCKSAMGIWTPIYHFEGHSPCHEKPKRTIKIFLRFRFFYAVNCHLTYICVNVQMVSLNGCYVYWLNNKFMELWKGQKCAKKPQNYYTGWAEIAAVAMSRRHNHNQHIFYSNIVSHRGVRFSPDKYRLSTPLYMCRQMNTCDTYRDPFNCRVITGNDWRKGQWSCSVSLTRLPSNAFL